MAPLRTSRLSLAAVCLLLVLLASSSSSSSSSSPRLARADSPTDGFTAVPLNGGNFMLQRPYNRPPGARYRFDGTVRTMWVLSSDKPYTSGSPTKPRTEMQITGYDYSSGVWQFEADAYVPAGSTGMSIMQVFGGSPTATTLMLHVYDGDLWYYNQRFVEGGIYNRWFRINVVHDVDGSVLTVFINGQQKLQVPGKGGDSHFFKFGVYEQRRESWYMESRWKNVRVLKKN